MVKISNPVLWAGFFIACTSLLSIYKLVLFYCLYVADKVPITVIQWEPSRQKRVARRATALNALQCKCVSILKSKVTARTLAFLFALRL